MKRIFYVTILLFFSTVYSQTEKLEKTIFEADSLFKNNSYDKALQLYEKALNNAQNSNNRESQAYIYEKIGTICFYKGDFNNALENYNKSFHLYSTKGIKAGIYRVLNNVGELYFNINDYEKATEIFRNGLNLAENENNLNRKINFLLKLSQSHKKNSNYSQAIYYLNNLQKLKLNKVEKFLTNMYAGEIYININQLDKGFQKLNYCKDNINNAPNYKYILYNNIANYYFKIKAYNKAKEYFEKSIQSINTQPDFNIIISDYENLGDINFLRKNYAYAYKYLDEAEKLAQKYEFNDRALKLKIKKEKSVFELNFKQKAIDELFWKLEELKDSNFLYATDYYMAEAELFISLNNYESAYTYIVPGIETAGKINYNNRLIDFYSILGYTFYLYNKPDSAKSFIDKGINLIENVPNWTFGKDIANTFEKYSKYYKYASLIFSDTTVNNFKKALEYSQKAKLAYYRSLFEDQYIYFENKDTLNKYYENLISLSNLNKEYLLVKNYNPEQKKYLNKISDNITKKYNELNNEKNLIKSELKELLFFTNYQYPDNYIDNIPQKTAILDYVKIDDIFFTFILKKNTITVEKLKVNEKSILKFIKEYSEEEIDGTSFNIYETLFKPTEKHLENVSSIIIIPDNYLVHLPFETLHTDTNNYEPKLLCDRYDFYYSILLPDFENLNNMISLKNILSVKPNNNLSKKDTLEVFDKVYEKKLKINEIKKVKYSLPDKIVVFSSNVQTLKKEKKYSAVVFDTPTIFSDSEFCFTGILQSESKIQNHLNYMDKINANVLIYPYSKVIKKHITDGSSIYTLLLASKIYEIKKVIYYNLPIKHNILDTFYPGTLNKIRKNASTEDYRANAKIFIN